MKCRIPPKKQISTKTLKACRNYIEELEKEIIVKAIKLFCVVLHNDYKFGLKRLNEITAKVSELAKDYVTDEIFWEHVDKLLIDKLNMDFKYEKYEELINENQVQ